MTSDLSKYNLKTTIQRLAVLNYLESTNEHPDAETIFKAVSAKYPAITLSTVYNTLDKFVEKGIVKKVFTPDGRSRYDAEHQKHFHLYDEASNEIVDVFDVELCELVENYIKNKDFGDFTVQDFRIELIGKVKK